MSAADDAIPPIAKKVPKRFALHGDVRIDNYYWMRDRSSPEVAKYVDAENRYTKRMMKHTEPLQKKLFKEMKSRIKETDSSVPMKIDDYYYYTRTVKGKQYSIRCRKKHSLSAKEEVILDENKEAKGKKFYHVGAAKVSPDQRLLAYLEDLSGSERFTLRVRDLSTGRMLRDRLLEVSTFEWANDNRTIVYSVLDEEWRPHKVYRHVLGTDAKKDRLIYHEKDPKFSHLSVDKSRARKFIIITVGSATTTEVHYLPADQPSSELKTICPRKHGISYYAIHNGDKFYIITDEHAINFKVMEAPDTNPSKKNWKELISHRKDVCLDVDPQPWAEAFDDHLVIYERKAAQGAVRIFDLKKRRSQYIKFPDKIFMATPLFNLDPGSEKAIIKYWTMVTPTRVYEYDLRKEKLTLKKEEKIIGYDRTKYVQDRFFATAKDGAKVPITIVHRKGLKKDGANPTYLYGYGAYGTFEWAESEFDSILVSLLDRGFVYAYAHVRGGGDMGKAWEEDGRMLHKVNTFTDLIACAEHLISAGYTSTEKLVVRGRSAGGLLMGAVTNMRPDLFKAVVAEVPFVDVLTTMLDPSIPLTAGEFEEWGDSRKPAEYRYMAKYSPYDNVVAKDYPNLLVTGSLNDTRVQYWEPLKWVAKLRDLKTDDNTLILRMGRLESHAGASGRYDYLRYAAFMYAFILDKLRVGT